MVQDWPSNQWHSDQLTAFAGTAARQLLAINANGAVAAAGHRVEGQDIERCLDAISLRYHFIKGNFTGHQSGLTGLAASVTLTARQQI